MHFFSIGKMILLFSSDDEAPNILKPISMNTITHELNKKKYDFHDDVIGCLLCKEQYPTAKKGEKSPLLAHLLTEHKIVIADVDKIADFNRLVVTKIDIKSESTGHLLFLNRGRDHGTWNVSSNDRIILFGFFQLRLEAIEIDHFQYF